MRFSSNVRSSARRPTGLVGKIGLTLFLSVFLAAGLFFGVMLGRSVWEAVVSYQWPEVSATVVSSGVGENPKADSPFFPEVTFRYQWEGRTYTSDRFSIVQSKDDSFDSVQREVAKYPVGAVVTCWVNPKDPSKAILTRGGLWIAVMLVVPLVFVLVGGGGIYSTWTGRKTQSEPLSSSVDPDASEKGGRWVVWLIGGVFTLIGGLMLGLWFLPTLAKSYDSKNWTETPCTVISSRVKSHRSDNSTTYSVDIFYRYSVDGKEYKSNRYAHLGGSSSGRDGKAAVVARYPPGKKAVCYVNPNDPSEVVLKPGVGWWLLIGLLPLTFLLIGLGVLIWGGKSSASASITPVRPAVGDGDPSVLKPSASPVMKVVGALIFAVFWNGIVSVFLWQVVAGFQRGKPEWFLTVFLIPFVLIGLGAICAVFYFLMALSNPRCRVRLSPSVLVPGQPVDVSWELTGAVHRLRRLVVYLEGREEASYSRGTSRYTDRETFARIPVADLKPGLEMGQGGVRCWLPEEVMPTFSAPNNKIVWALHVQGEIQRWPDVSEEFPVDVVAGGPL